MIQVLKRDGKKDPFTEQRIIDAVSKALGQEGIMDIDYATSVANTVHDGIVYNELEEVSVDYIQEEVEYCLMKSYPHVARVYIEYRHERDKARELASSLHKSILGLVNQTNEEVLTENANKEGAVFSTQRDLLAGEVARHYALQYLLPPVISKAHKESDIHFHDLDYFPLMGMTNCCLVDLNGMLTHGFKMGNAHIEQPNSIQTAATIVSQIAAAVANSQYGGTSFDRLDEVLAPYVMKTHKKNVSKYAEILTKLKGKLTPEDTKTVNELAMGDTEKAAFDACQTLEYQVNTIYCTNGQTPFITFGFGIGTDWASKLIQRGILQNRINGLGAKKVTAIFPKFVFGIKDGVNFKEGDPNYDIKQLALKCATLRMYPDILNYDKTVEVTGGYKAPMGCRSFLGCKEIQGKEVYAGRNNLGVVSVNITKAAVRAKGDVNLFWKYLEEQTELAHTALRYRLERLATVQAKSAPILYMEGALGLRLQPEDFVLQHLLERGASISLGYIGLEETANALFGVEVHTYDSEEKKEFLLEVIKYLEQKVKTWKFNEGVDYSLYATPSESLCNRFCKAIESQFGKIKGVTDKGYLTNSFHLDVLKKVNPYDKIDFEEKFITHSAGGHICYGEYPSLVTNPKALEDVWDYSYYHVPYYGTNTPVDHCFLCDFKGEFSCTSEGFTCPKCNNKDPQQCSITRRVCGYLGNPTTRPFNPGKQSEMTKRVKHLESATFTLIDDGGSEL